MYFDYFDVVESAVKFSVVYTFNKPTVKTQTLSYTRIFLVVDALRPRQNDRYFAENIFKCIFLIENVWISIKMSLKPVPWGQINNIPSLVQIMAWCRAGDMRLSEPMMVSLLTHICVTRPQWVKTLLLLLLVVVAVVVVVIILLTLGVKTDPWVIQNNIKYHKIKLNG